MGGPRALCPWLFFRCARRLLHGRRRAPRQGRLLLGDGSRRRRAGPAVDEHRGGVGAVPNSRTEPRRARKPGAEERRGKLLAVTDRGAIKATGSAARGDSPRVSDPGGPAATGGT